MGKRELKYGKIRGWRADRYVFKINFVFHNEKSVGIHVLLFYKIIKLREIIVFLTL